MRTFAYRTRQHGSRPVYVPAALATASHVYLRVDTQRATLTPPYDGPYKVLGRYEKNFDVEVNGEKKRISIDRLKPAYLLRKDAPEPVLNPPPSRPVTRPIRQVRINTIPTYCK